MDSEAAELCAAEFQRFAQQAAKVVDRKVALGPDISKARRSSHLKIYLDIFQENLTYLSSLTGGSTNGDASCRGRDAGAAMHLKSFEELFAGAATHCASEQG